MDGAGTVNTFQSLLPMFKQTYASGGNKKVWKEAMTSKTPVRKRFHNLKKYLKGESNAKS